MDLQQMGSISQFGLMNSLRTGNVALDMLLAFVIPLVFSAGFQAIEKIKPTFYKYLNAWRTGSPNEFVRSVAYQKKQGSWGVIGNQETNRNYILQKALTLYIGQMKQKTYENANVHLIQTTNKRHYGGYDSDDDSSSNAKQLKTLELSTMPRVGQWVELEDGVSFIHDEQVEESGEKKPIEKISTTFTLKATGANAEERVNKFVEKAFNWYKDLMQSQRDKGRYMYVLLESKTSMSSEDEDNGEDAEKRLYKRYLLSDEKTFNSLFFPEKEALIEIVNNFQQKKGKFAIPGFPHKLGLLLHGPPGTGKTSLIKALAQYTGRHIVSVPLGRIRTNQELMDCMFDQCFSIGDDLPIKLKFSQIIFVMEDVDCATNIVHRREPAKENQSSTLTFQTSVVHSLQSAAATSVGGSDLATMLRTMSNAIPTADGETDDAPIKKKSSGPKVVIKEEKDDKDDKDDKEDKEEKDDKDDKDTDKDKEGDKDGEEKDDDKEDEDGEEGEKDTTGPSKVKSKWDKDALDLAGLLNVLDGVVDTPNRILIMTTNHPEKLDPALIRPGRINKKIYLGYTEAPEACQMVKHYFGDLKADDQRELEKVIESNGTFTPAEVEQHCAEHNTVDDMLTALRKVKKKKIVLA